MDPDKDVFLRADWVWHDGRENDQSENPYAHLACLAEAFLPPEEFERLNKKRIR